jgi:hypothetical protein
MGQEKKEGAPGTNEAGGTLEADMAFPPIGEEEQEPTSQGTEADARLQALEERVERDQKAFADERTKWQQTVDRLIQTQAAPPKQEENAPQPINFSDLPDPVDKPEDFKRALAQKFETEMSQRLSSTVEEVQQRNDTQQSTNQKLDAMWAKFQQDHSDVATKTATLQGAVMAERGALQQGGADPTQRILADPDGFMSRVADRMRSELGVPAPGAPTAPPAPGQPKATRTAGVGGGTQAGESGTGKSKQPAGFTDQLKKFQLESGLI